MKKLTKFTSLAIISIIFDFVLKAIGSFAPNLFIESAQLRMSSSLLTFVFSLAIVFFFYFFIKEFLAIHQSGLRFASKCVFVASILMSILYFYKFIALNMNTESWNYYYDFSSALFPVVYSISLLLFFIFFFMEALPGDLITLRRSTIIMITATSFISLLRTVQFFYFIQLTDQENASTLQDIMIIGIPFILLEFGAFVHFFRIFYKLLKKDYWD